ncbi:MAG: UDP-N-acetylmuramoyl-L-alanyl-D-glutamate--2,6-diaminopimelate ligase [Candidatus Omnitrophica bacterium]|nr:UDP-N-acetylmuramoyl-L-alanyl-D-glutamate--2,6-diaminopimelate ligase [Candidatus Omnitrophota bacterium]
MKLTQLIKVLGKNLSAPASGDFEVQGIACDSQKVGQDFVFVAIRGVNFDGHKFIDEAIKRGARFVVVQRPVSASGNRDKGVMFVEVEDTRKALADLAAFFYGEPSKKLKVIGVTGTNGKTTISYLLEAILKRAGFIPAVVGTVNYRFRDKIIVAKNTTPGPLELQALFSDMLKEKVDYAAMEVSSHALDQKRVEGINFCAAVFTNLTQDHLDYHGTLEGYFLAKLKLFQGLSGSSRAIVNIDDPYGLRIKGLTLAKFVGYSIDNPAEVRAIDLECGITDTKFKVKAKRQTLSLRSRLIGKHNVYNILAAVAFSLKEGIEAKVIKEAIEDFVFVPGRLERIDARAGFSVFVDYAHTPDALYNVLTALRQVSLGGRIIAVFGCGGDRDKGKRPKMGQIASELADYVFITSDNPRSEAPEAIISDIQKGITKDNYTTEADRRQAIERALQSAKSGDIVLVAGKGHEDYQIFKDKTIHFSDQEVVRECLRLKI